jgi:hypothetical protein
MACEGEGGHEGAVCGARVSTRNHENPQCANGTHLCRVSFLLDFFVASVPKKVPVTVWVTSIHDPGPILPPFLAAFLKDWPILSISVFWGLSGIHMEKLRRF